MNAVIPAVIVALGAVLAAYVTASAVTLQVVVVTQPAPPPAPSVAPPALVIAPQPAPPPVSIVAPPALNAVPPAAPPPAPTDLKAVAGNGQVSLSWTASAGTATYNVYRGASPGGEGAVPIQTALATTSFTDSGLANGVTFFYVVSAVNVGGGGARSDEASATPQAPAPPPPAHLDDEASIQTPQRATIVLVIGISYKATLLGVTTTKVLFRTANQTNAHMAYDRSEVRAMITTQGTYLYNKDKDRFEIQGETLAKVR